LNGQVEIERLNEIFDVQFDSESRTLGGLIIENMEEIPVPDKKIKINGILFTVKKVNRNRVTEVEARIDK
jgi:CBS domain containing-hemolysin-like protein